MMVGAQANVTLSARKSKGYEKSHPDVDDCKPGRTAPSRKRGSLLTLLVAVVTVAAGSGIGIYTGAVFSGGSPDAPSRVSRKIGPSGGADAAQVGLGSVVSDFSARRDINSKPALGNAPAADEQQQGGQQQVAAPASQQPQQQQQQQQQQRQLPQQQQQQQQTGQEVAAGGSALPAAVKQDASAVGQVRGEGVEGTKVPLTLAERVAANIIDAAAKPQDPVQPVPKKVSGSSGLVKFFPWDLPMKAQEVCGDTCPTALNGICEEGRTPDGIAQLPVRCDLGTDCSDCGPWKFSGPQGPAAADADTPIKRLKDKGVEVNVRWTSTKPSFLMPFTDPQHDVDVSGQMAAHGAVEMGLTQVWYYRLKEKCIKPDGSRALVVDVGGNFGWYSLYAAALGCRVIAWEPVPHFRDFFLYGTALNNFSHLIQIRDSLVADAPGEYDLVVPQRGIWGTAGVGGWNIDKGIDNVKPYDHLMLPGERVDSVVHEDVALLKMDVEGFEPAVLRSASTLFERHAVDNVVMEYSPGAYEANGKWAEYKEVPGMLTFLAGKGFTLLHVHDTLTRAYVRETWEQAPPHLAEILPENLRFDMEDATKLQLRTMGCSSPQELVQKYSIWSGCNFIPEDLHPKSFRGSFGHNTNVWAIRERASGMPIGPPVGVFSLDQDLHEWFTRTDSGMAGRPCKHLQPNVQVRHRCPCTVASVCGEEQALVAYFAKEGRMTPLGTGAPGGGQDPLPLSAAQPHIILPAAQQQQAQPQQEQHLPALFGQQVTA